MFVFLTMARRSGVYRMIARLFFLLCMGLLAAPAQAARLAVEDEPAFLQIPKQLAVKILRGPPPTANFIGTGFTWVSRGRAYAVTNFHVAQKGLAAEPLPGGLHVGFPAPVDWHPSTHMLGVPAADLAIIATDVVTPQAQENPYTLGKAKMGEAVYSISYDQEAFAQAAPMVFKGEVVGMAGGFFPSSTLQIKPPMPPDAVQVYIIDGSDCVYGASGSMLLNSKGELFAYNAGRLDNGLCVAVAIEEVTRALER